MCVCERERERVCVWGGGGGGGGGRTCKHDRILFVCSFNITLVDHQLPIFPVWCPWAVVSILQSH